MNNGSWGPHQLILGGSILEWLALEDLCLLLKGLHLWPLHHQRLELLVIRLVVPESDHPGPTSHTKKAKASVSQQRDI